MEGEERFIPMLKNRTIDNEPDWLTGDIGKYLFPEETVNLEPHENGLVPYPVQQGDLLRPVYMDIVKYGLNYAYRKYSDSNPYGEVPSFLSRPDYKFTKTDKPRNVIIVGAGMAGLSAAYELAQVGHNVQILEMQERVGGRVKTFGEKEGFDKHLYVDSKEGKLSAVCIILWCGLHFVLFDPMI